MTKEPEKSVKNGSDSENEVQRQLELAASGRQTAGIEEFLRIVRKEGS